MLLMVSSINRKQQDAGVAREHGEFLAGWLNRVEEKAPDEAKNALLETLGVRPKPRGFIKGFALRRKRDTENFLRRVLDFYLGAEKDLWEVRRHVGHRYPGRFQLGEKETWDYILQTVKSLHPSGGKAVQGDKIRLSTHHMQLAFDAEFRRGDNNGVTFEIVPANDYSRVVLALASLTGSGDAGRVRRCRGCGRFFFADRADKQDCSARCKTAYWQRTEQGRETKAAYMRKWRANPCSPYYRERHAAPKGYTRKRGRKLHDSLKKGE